MHLIRSSALLRSLAPIPACCALAALTTQAAAQSVLLQPTSPGVTQVGNTNISGRMIAESLFIRKKLICGGTILTKRMDAVSTVAGEDAIDARSSVNGTYGVVAGERGLWGWATGGALHPYGVGVQGESSAISGYGVLGMFGPTSSLNLNLYAGVWGDSASSIGVLATTGDTTLPAGFGVCGMRSVIGATMPIFPSAGKGLWGDSATQIGVGGSSDTGNGVVGVSSTGIGAQGYSVSGYGVKGESNTGIGVRGYSGSGLGLEGRSDNSIGISGSSGAGIGILATGNPALQADGPVVINGYLNVNGNLGVSGTKNFVIDHPLDPEHKTLTHFCTEGAEPLNNYSGNVVTDASGGAVVTLPEWFEAINRDVRYQLTVVDERDGADFVQVKVAQKVLDHKFRIRTSAPNIEVSWQVTGVRNDAWVRAHPCVVEQLREAPLSPSK